MTTTRFIPVTAFLAIAALAFGGCGSSSSSSKSQPAGGGSEAKSAATGDIPDNQVFLTYRDRGAGYSLTYPEGWTRRGAGRHLTFSEKGNSVDLVVASSRAPSPWTVRSAPKPVKLKHGAAIKATYSHVGPPDPVTGKRPLLLVDRYVYKRGPDTATLDLSTPKGVDNVDAYRLIANSFQWR
jgi:hypothetical protein